MLTLALLVFVGATTARPRHADEVGPSAKRPRKQKNRKRGHGKYFVTDVITNDIIEFPDTPAGYNDCRTMMRRVTQIASAVSRSMHTAACTTEIVAIAVYQVDRHSKCDRILLEERMIPALCCGGACGTIGFPGGKVDEEDQGSLRRTMQRELREELVFTDKGAPHQVQPVGPVGRVELGPFRISLFTARIPPTATVACTPGYHPRVKALHWRRPTAIRNSTDPRMMPSTELLLDMVPFPPPSHTGTGKAQTVGVDLPSSGRVPRQPNAPRKRKRAAARGE